MVWFAMAEFPFTDHLTTRQAHLVESWRRIHTDAYILDVNVRGRERPVQNEPCLSG